MDAVNNQQQRDTTVAIINIGLASALLLLQSWIADGLEGNELFPWLTEGLQLGKNTPYAALLLLSMTLLALMLAWKLYERRQTFLPIQIQRIGKPDAVEPHAILVLTVSKPGAWRYDPISAKIIGKDKEISLDGTLDEVLTRLASLGERERFAWEQLLRAIRKHAESGMLRQIWLVGSPGKDGTAERFTECRAFLRQFYPNIGIDDFHREEIGFEDIDGLLSVYRTILLCAGQEKKQLMIDVTGGTKVVSIAAAMVTMEHPEIEFQYVETQGDKRVRSFNVTGSGYEVGQ